MSLRQIYLTLLILFAAPATALCDEVAPVQNETRSLEVVEQFVDAYNAHDTDKMMTFCGDDVSWLSVSADSMVAEVRGKEALRSAMYDHFAGGPKTTSVLLKINTHGPMVMAIEKASSNSGPDARPQCSASVYEIRQGRIQNVWYFPAYKCD